MISWRVSMVLMVTAVFLLSISISAQTLFQGPASGSIAGGSAYVLKNAQKKAPVLAPQKKFHNLLWSKYNPDPYPDELNHVAPSGPVGSNFFFDPAVSGQAAKGASDTPPSTMLSFDGDFNTGGFPPDPIIAAGPDHVMALVNSVIHIYDKQGNLLRVVSADSWFLNVLNNNNAFDPTIIYDQFEDRWVMCWDNQNQASQTAFWLVAVSEGPDPLGTWFNFAFPAHLNGMDDVGNWGDFQKIGYDTEALYISGRQFAFGGGFDYCKLRIIPKSELYAGDGGPVTYKDFWDFRTPGNATVVVDGPPIVASHLDASGTAYMVVDSPFQTSTYITLWKINNPLDPNPVLTATNIPTAAAPQPIDAQQLGFGTRIDVGRRAYRHAVYQDGELWTATHQAGGSSNGFTFSRYVRLDVENNTLVEDAAIGANGFYYYYPTVMVDGDKNLFLAFSRSGTSEYVAAAFTGRQEGDPEGLAPSVVMKEGEANYVQTGGDTRNRWGDYMGIAQDPDFRNVIWTMVEYADSPSNNYGNWIAALSYSLYSSTGVITSSTDNQPIEFATVSSVESGQQSETAADGVYEITVPLETPTLLVEAFAHQSQEVPTTLLVNDTITADFVLDPQLEAVLSGQVLDPGTGLGIQADLQFFAEGNPSEEPYQTLTTDADGNYSVQTIIGNYDIDISPISPYPVTLLSGVNLDTLGTAFNIELTPAKVMVVDDDDGDDFESFFATALADSGISYHPWDVTVSGSPALADINEYPSGIVAWFTGNAATTLTADELSNLHSHLTNGGRIFLTGQNIVEQNATSDLFTTMGMDFANDTGLPVITGVDGEFSEGLAFTTVGGSGASNQTSRDNISITDTSTTRDVFRYGNSPSLVAGAVYESGSGTGLVLGFGFEAINTVAAQSEVMDAIVAFLDSSVVVGIEDGADLPIADGYHLAQNYPNPFNPSTTIEFTVPAVSEVELTIYNVRGQRIRTLVSGNMTVGTHQAVWDGSDQHGQHVASGIYLYRLNVGEAFSDIKKMVYLR